MDRSFLKLSTLLFVTGVGLLADQAAPPDLVAMADTERAFAQAGATKGVRDAFLEYFADDAVGFGPTLGLAKDDLRKSPSRPPSAVLLEWGPRYGDIAASGEVGFLTGPARTTVNEPQKRPPTYGCYFSIWKKQTDGAFRVFIDLGTDAPAPCAFASESFEASPRTRKAASASDASKASTQVTEAERTLAAQVKSSGLADAYAKVLSEAPRVHRGGAQPYVGRAAILGYLRSVKAAPSLGAPAKVEAAKSGDFAWAWGEFETPASDASPAASGYYVHVWTRDNVGPWRLAVDVTNIKRPPR